MTKSLRLRIAIGTFGYGTLKLELKSDGLFKKTDMMFWNNFEENIVTNLKKENPVKVELQLRLLEALEKDVCC
uniref:Uncharacterized protein n=1 Tax=Megaselia scalaris TaxID=36166 RepID=T1H2A4_MEGSC